MNVCVNSINKIEFPIGYDSFIQERLDKISGTKKLGQKLDPRYFHSFPARMPLALADYLIKQFTSKDDLVLDPMVGSGTTVVASKINGRNSIGIDIDPLAQMISKVATNDYSVESIESLGKRVLSRAITNEDNRKHIWTRLKEIGFEKEEIEFVKFWFPLKSQHQLCSLSESIHKEKPGKYRDLAWVIFSSLVIVKSVGPSFALDLSRTRPHKVEDKKILFPFEGWNKKIKSFTSSLPCHRYEFIKRKSDILIGDSRSLSVADNSIDFIITSPPYVVAVDYIRAHKFSLIWMGHNLSHLREIRGTMIGSERTSSIDSGHALPGNIEDRLIRKITNPKKRAITKRYLIDISYSLSEMARVLKQNKLAVFVLGPTIINQSQTDSADIFTNLAETHGLSFSAKSVRHINTVRRSLPPPHWIGKKNSMGKRMKREALLVLRKQ